MYAMQANGYGLGSAETVLTDHVKGYLEQPAAYSLTDWDSDPDGSAYGAVYLFVTYLVDRYGEGILKELVDAPNVGELSFLPHSVHYYALQGQGGSFNLSVKASGVKGLLLTR